LGFGNFAKFWLKFHYLRCSWHILLDWFLHTEITFQFMYLFHFLECTLQFILYTLLAIIWWGSIIHFHYCLSDKFSNRSLALPRWWSLSTHLKAFFLALLEFFGPLSDVCSFINLILLFDCYDGFFHWMQFFLFENFSIFHLI